MTFDLARNTKEAEDYLKRTRYAVVISDFYRTDDSIGGYTLLRGGEADTQRAPVHNLFGVSSSRSGCGG